MRRKALFLLLWCCLLTTMGMQATTNKMLVVETNGGKFSFVLSDNLQITFNGQTMTISTGSDIQGFEIADVTQYYFEDNATNVKDLQTGELRISQRDYQQIVVEGILPLSAVKLYAMDGKELLGRITLSDGRATVSLLSLPKGVYVISANKKQNIKIIKQ